MISKFLIYLRIFISFVFDAFIYFFLLYVFWPSEHESHPKKWIKSGVVRYIRLRRLSYSTILFTEITCKSHFIVINKNYLSKCTNYLNKCTAIICVWYVYSSSQMTLIDESKCYRTNQKHIYLQGIISTYYFSNFDTSSLTLTCCLINEQKYQKRQLYFGEKVF